MYKIRFYKDRRGKRPVADYLKRLDEKTDKDSRIKLTKIREYLSVLQNGGTMIGEPYIKHLNGEIWELRPIKDRILFAAWDGDKFLLLHHFVKKTQKTPPHEIKQALRNLADWKERGQYDE
jgi:phage-related protein